MRYKFLLVLAILLLCACGEKEPQVKIDAENRMNQYFHVPFVRVTVTSRVDSVDIKNIIVNRGNCKIENQLVPGINNGMTIIPRHLAYGQSVSVTFSGPCEASQVDVVTGNDTWTQTYQ